MLLHETISIPEGPAEFVACCEKAVPQTNKLTPSKNSLARLCCKSLFNLREAGLN